MIGSRHTSLKPKHLGIDRLAEIRRWWMTAEEEISDGEELQQFHVAGIEFADLVMVPLEPS